MTSAALRFSPDNLASRLGFSFTASVVLHMSLPLAVMLLSEDKPPPAPLEISILPGPPGDTSPPPGDKSNEAGSGGTPPTKVEPAPEKVTRKAVTKAKPKQVAKRRPAPKARVEDQGLLLTLRKNAPTPKTRSQAFEGSSSTVALHARPEELGSEEGSSLGVPRAKTAASVGTDVVPSGPARGDSLGESVGGVQFPGPGGRESGWGGFKSDGGGTGRGGFTVTGAGSGGSSRSHASIWQHTQRYLAGLRLAYNNGLHRKPSLRGVVTVRYEILPNGPVGSVQMTLSSMRDVTLEQEVLRQIRGWRYPAEPTGSVVVTWPFSFLPSS